MYFKKYFDKNMQTASKESVRVESVPDRHQREGGGSALAFQLEQVDSPLWGVGLLVQMGRAEGPCRRLRHAFPSPVPAWVQDRMLVRPEVLSLEPWEGARYHEHSTGGTVPSASASSWGSRGCIYPAALAGILSSRGRSLSSPESGSDAGHPN